MVEKQTKKPNKRSAVDQHNVTTGNQYADLEKRLEIVLEKLNEMALEVLALQQQQTVLIELVKSKSKL